MESSRPHSVPTPQMTIMLPKIKSIVRSVLPNEWTESLHRLKLGALNFVWGRYCPC